MKRFYLLIPLILIALGFSCGKKQATPSARYTAFDKMLNYAKPLAFGEDSDVYVFASAKNWQMLELLLRSSIERKVRLVYEEAYFNLIKVELKDVDKYLQYKNLLFIGDLKAKDEITQYMLSSLNPGYPQRVQQSGGDLFTARNHNSRDQIILYLLGKDKNSLSNTATLQSDNIFSLLLKRYGERQAYQAFRGKVIEAGFWKPYPFSMQIPDTYRLYSNDKAGRFLSFLYRARIPDREIPDKYISVYYEDMPADEVTADWLFNKRQELWQARFEGDTIRKENLRSEAFKFAGYQGYRISGPWENQKLVIGGAFQTMAFWHPDSKRAYLIDNSVFFPAGDKLAILLELHMISSSLRIK